MQAKAVNLSKVSLSARTSESVAARQARIRVQAMLDAETSERVKAQALRHGVSVSAMAAILIKSALDALPAEEKIFGNPSMEDKLRAIITLAEQEGLL